MTARLMKVSGLAETLPVERTRKPARPAAKPAATRRRAPAAKSAVALDVASTPEETPAELPSARVGRGRRLRRLALVSMGLVVLLAAAAVAAFLLLDPFDRGEAGAPAAISAEKLASFASSHDGPVYWAGTLRLTAARGHDDERRDVRQVPAAERAGRRLRASDHGRDLSAAQRLCDGGQPVEGSGDDVPRDVRRWPRRVEPEAPDERLRGLPRRASSRRGLRAGRRRCSHARAVRAHSPRSLVLVYGFR